MKKLLCLFLIVPFLFGCSTISKVLSNNDVETLKDWSFQYNSETDDYSLFFGLINGNNKYISADANVDIRIINDKDELIYSANRTISKEDFGYYQSIIYGKKYLANIRIPAEKVTKGKTRNGTIYFTVYSDAFRFEEVSYSVNSLLVADAHLNAANLPVELRCKDYRGNTTSKIKITEVQYEFEFEYSSCLKITVIGQKTYGNSNSDYEIVSYKLYDSEGYLIDFGNIYLRSLSNGDKFRDDSIIIRDVVPGETYTIRFFEYDN